MTLESVESGHIESGHITADFCSGAAGLSDRRRASENPAPPTPEGPRQLAHAGGRRAGARPMALQPPGARRGARRAGAAWSGPADCAPQGRRAAPGHCAAPAAPGWGAPAAPMAPPGIWAWGGATGWMPPAPWAQPRPSLQEKLQAAKQPMKVQSSLGAVEPDAGQGGEEAGREALVARRGTSAGPPAERPPEAPGRSPASPSPARAGGGQDCCSSGLLEPVREPAGAIMWTHLWEIDSKILKSGGSRVASPEFQLSLPGHEPTKLALMLNTHKESLGTVGKGRHSFKKSRGCGRVMVKCKGGPLAASTFGIALWLEGDEEVSRHRPTVQHSFAERSAYEHEWWQLKGDPDQAKLTVGLRLTLAAPAAEGLQLALTTTASVSASASSAPALVPAATGGPPGIGGAAGAPPVDLGPPPGLEILEVARCAAGDAEKDALCRGEVPTLQRAAWSR